MKNERKGTQLVMARSLKILADRSNVLRRFFLITLLGLAAYLRWPYIFVDRLWPDEALYLWYGQLLHHTPFQMFSSQIVQYHPPLFPLLLSLGYFFPNPEVASRLLTTLINILGLCGIYWVGKDVGGRFCGIFSAVALAFNFLYVSAANRLLIDGTFTVAWIFLILALAQVKNQNQRFVDLIVGAAGVGLILLKWPGVLALAVVAAYYAFGLPDVPFKNRIMRLRLPALMMGAVIVALLVNNWIQLGTILPDTSALQGLYLIKPFWYYAANLHNILILPVLIPFLIAGLVTVFQKPTKPSFAIGIWFIVLFVALSLTPEKDLRYALLILPSSLLLSAIGLEKTFRFFLKRPAQVFFAKTICVLSLLIFFGALWPRTQMFLERGGKQFVGFKEAGKWLSKNQNSATLVLAGSPRAIRYYSGINFQEFGGKLASLPQDAWQLAELIAVTKTPIIIVLDKWEGTQPDWAFPVTDAVMARLRGMGFSLVLTVERSIPALDRTDRIEPVVWIFQHP